MKIIKPILYLSIIFISISVNSQITTTEGLENLETIQGDLIISNTQLTNLDGLVGLNSVSGNLIIKNNSALTNYCGLQKLLSTGTIGGTTEIDGNLIDLDATNLDFSACTILGLDDYVTNLNNTYPNPVVDILHFSNSDTVKTISIFNMMGQKVFSAENITTQINISHLSSGSYFIKLQDADNNTTVNKILKN